MNTRLLVLVALAAATITACGRGTEAEVGHYTASTLVAGDPGFGEWQEAPRLKLEIERAPDRLVLRDERGTMLVETTLTARDEPFHGCPDNLSAADMEVLALGVAHLSVAGLELDAPILVADCGQSDGEAPPLALRDAGEPGDGFGGACDGARQGCIEFYLDGSGNDSNLL